ncbi:TOMM precursor leader peptide-binding protein [Actinomyces slackii]|uniref:Bacteriocin biosynthesis cyclodehydratase domain n=1 Tax=Actinomyces slackii TaxID=52774 RepID=A0A3S5EM30_9ACTO|nr:TOMM precursor leader peptide-binding protein [Actinomyces slackii]VEG73871.1 bacteriocin biosynthesis cyclodehydratase domain [Actinomyces slackii]
MSTTRPVTAYLPQGGFGHAVARRLAGPHDPVLPVDDGLASAAVPFAERLVMICDPEQSELRQALDALSFARRLPSVGLELDPTELRCGPLVVPGASACHTCLTRRRRQHGHRPRPEGLAPLPQGYAHHHVVIGAGLIGLALEALDNGPQDEGIGGQVWTMDLVSGATACARTVAVDRCPTCSGRYAARRGSLAGFAELLPHRREVG